MASSIKFNSMLSFFRALAIDLPILTNSPWYGATRTPLICFVPLITIPFVSFQAITPDVTRHPDHISARHYTSNVVQSEYVEHGAPYLINLSRIAHASHRVVPAKLASCLPVSASEPADKR